HDYEQYLFYATQDSNDELSRSGTWIVVAAIIWPKMRASFLCCAAHRMFFCFLFSPGHCAAREDFCATRKVVFLGWLCLCELRRAQACATPRADPCWLGLTFVDF
ncbi:hypothetical protein A2U01_0052697, partial [Trifolium medium]|nr:hypothetical protein [Trifolium medium]